MLRVSKFKIITFDKKSYKCCVGKLGLTKKKKEGDLKTPIGNYNILKCYFRPDRIKKINTKIKCKKIRRNSAWCDDVRSKYYNKPIKLPSKFRYEKLYRKDNCYDLIVVLNYNMNPIVKGKGSAIFLHIAKKNYKPTEGCIAVKKEDLLEILRKIKRKTKILIK